MAAGSMDSGRGRTRSRFLAGAVTDAKLGLRGLMRRPAFAGLVVVTLGLGIGVSASVFGTLDRIVLRPLPYENGDRLSYLSLADTERGWQFAPFADVIERWREGSRTVERIETYRHLTGEVTGEGEARIARVVGVSAGLPDMLGVRARLGRIPVRGGGAAVDGPVLIASERYWRGDWGSDPGVVGRTVRMNDTLFTVVGVWPETARLDFRGAPDFFRILPPEEESPRGDFTMVLGLLRPGVTADVVEAELAPMLEGIEDAPPRMTPVVTPPYGFLGNDYIRGLWLVFWGAILLMVVAVLTATNLMLGRAGSRTGEIGMRRALGASRVRLARLFLIESSLLCGAGLAVALAVGTAVGAGMRVLEPGNLVPPGSSGLADAAMLFAGGLALIAAVMCAVVPLAIVGRAAGPLGNASGPRATGRRSRFRSAVLAAQGALAVVLMTGAALMARSLTALTNVDPGMALDELLITSVSLPADRYADESARTAFYDEVRAAIAALPGVRGVTRSSAPPMAFSIRGGVPYLDGEPEPVPTGAEFVAEASVPEGYFEVVGIPLVEGREPSEAVERSVVVNQAFARSRTGGVLGRTLRFPGDTLSWTVVGVAGDIRSNGLTDTPERIQLYFAGSSGSRYIRFLIRTAGAPAGLLAPVRGTITAIDPALPLREARTGPDILREEASRTRFVAALLAGFAALGLVFAVGGVYGAMSNEAGRRLREVGLRMALGASAGHVARRAVVAGLAPVAAGALVGSFAVLWAAPILEAVLFQTRARDPLSLLAGVSILFAAAALGSSAPALRASRVDPAIVLRND